MKKIMLVSDTHYCQDKFLDELKKYKDLDLIIHLGDCVEDAKYIKKNINIPIEYVRGNNDYSSFGVPDDLILNIEKLKIFITHGHKYSVYFGIDNLYYRAKEIGCDVVFFGHTHMYLYEKLEDITILNPGSFSYARGDGLESYCILSLDKGKIGVERVKI